MDSNNWRPAQSDPLQQQQQLSSLDIVGGVGGGGVDDPNWRAGLLLESRHRIVNKIMDTLKRHLPVSGHEGLNELKKIAVRFEEKIYTAASSQSDYLRKISLKMLTMENKNQPNGTPPPDQASSQSMQSQVLNQGQGQSIPLPLSGNQSQTRQQLLPQNNLTSAGVQSSAGIQSSMPLVNTMNQNSGVQNSSGVSQNVVGNSMGQGLPSNVFTNSQRPMQSRQQVTPHQQQNPQNPQYLYQQQFQQQIMKQKQQQGNMQHSLMQPHIQPQQQNIIQSSPLQSSQQSNMQTSTAMQPSVMQTTPLSTLQQTQQPTLQQSTQSILQQHPQSVLRQQPPQQASSIHQQHTQIMQQPMLSAQQQQLIGQQPNITNLQQNQLIGQQSSLTDMQQQQRLLSQQNNNPNLQQQQLMTQQNSLSNVHQTQMGSQSNTSGSQQQQQQLLGTQSVNTGMQTNQHSLHMLQQSKVPMQQQTHQTASNSLLPQGQQQQQQQQQQQPQQPLMSQIQSQTPQLQQQLNLQQQNPLQRLQISNILQPHTVIDQQKQLFLSQRNLPEASSTSLDSTAQTGLANAGDWQEEAYQKIKTMKELYFQDLNEMFMKVAGKLNQHESLPQQPGTDQLVKLKQFKVMLERLMAYLQVSKSTVTLSLKEKIGGIEKQIISFLNSNRPRKPVSSIQQGQLPPPHMHSLQQSQQAQSQITQVQPHENLTNSQLQPMNLQQNNMKHILHGSMTSLSVAPNGQQNMLNTIQSGSNLDSGQGNTLNSLQQVAVSAPNQTNINTLSSSQGGVNVLQPSINGLQSNSNMMQHPHLKQQQEQHMMQTQFNQQYQQRQIQQQQQMMMIQKQHILQQQQQQLHQQTKQQPTQSQTHQINDADLKIRQGMGVKPGVFLQHHAAAQRSSVYQQHQIKSGGSFPISSPQHLQTASPQNPQQSSPQIEQQNTLSSFSKAGTPLQSTHSPFVVQSPQTPLAPSPMPGDPDNKHASGITSIANAGNMGLQQANGLPAQSLAIGTPGMSASPLLAEFTSQDGNHGNASTIMSGRSNATEQPLERLMKAVKAMSSKALNASISDISSVVSMIDRIAGSAPGNGSRATVGEDLVAMTKCRLQARNFITQDGSTGTKRMRRYTSAMPLVVVSSFGSSKQLTGSETYDLESTATSITKRPRIEASRTLLEEIREINQRLIDTVVDFSDEDADPTAAAAAEGCEGTIVKCSFSAVALSPNLKSQYTSAQMSPIQPLRLLVPHNYPNCSPVLLDKFPVEVSKEHEDLSEKAKSRFSISLRCLSQPMSLGEIARTWDVCARAVILEYAQQSGGGSFSSRYGSWKNCLTAA